jgi:predicted DNA-binding protein
MIRTNIYLAADQVERLKTLAGKKGTTVAELVRRSIEVYLEAEENRQERRERRRGNAK